MLTILIYWNKKKYHAQKTENIVDRSKWLVLQADVSSPECTTDHNITFSLYLIIKYSKIQTLESDNNRIKIAYTEKNEK
jgi:hypothetical protein